MILTVGHGTQSVQELIAEIADLLDPLDAFAAAGERFRKLKVRPPPGTRPDRA